MADVFSEYGGAATAAEAPPTTPPKNDAFAQYGGSAQSADEIAQDPSFDPFVAAEKLHRQINQQSMLAGADSTAAFAHHPLFPVYAEAQAQRVKQKATDPSYDPLQEMYGTHANDPKWMAQFGLKAQPADPADEKLFNENPALYAAQNEEREAAKSARQQEAFRVAKYRLQNFGSLGAPGHWGHALKEGGKELFGILPTARGAVYGAEDVAGNLLTRTGDPNDPRNAARGEIAQRELQSGLQRGTLGVGNFGTDLANWWANKTWLPGGKPYAQMSDEEIAKHLNNQLYWKVIEPERLKMENFHNWLGGADQPEFKELTDTLGGQPKAYLSGIRFGQPTTLDSAGKEIPAPLPTGSEARAGDIGTAAEMAQMAALGEVPGLSQIGRLAGTGAAMALRTPLWLAKTTGKGFGAAYKFMKAVRNISEAAKAASETFAKTAPAAEAAATNAGTGMLRNFWEGSIPQEMWQGVPLKQRGRIGGALAEGGKGFLKSAGAALPFAAATQDNDQAASTLLGLGLLGALTHGGGELVTGNAWKTAAVSKLAQQGATLRTGTPYDAIHDAAAAKLPADQAAQLNAVRGLLSKFKDENGRPFQLHAVDGPTYRKVLEQYHPGATPAELDEAAATRGYYRSPDGKAFVNVDAAGDAGDTAFHEGGHAVEDALKALNATVRDSARAAIADTLYTSNGKPVPQFARFIKGYNQAAPAAGRIDIATPEGKARAESEFIAEHFRNVGEQTSAKGLGSLVTGDTLWGKIGKRFDLWAKQSGLRLPDELGEFGWREIPAFTARFNQILGDAFKGAHTAPAAEASAVGKVAQNADRMREIEAMAPRDRTPAIAAEYDRLRRENETIKQQLANIPPPAPTSQPNTPGNAPTSPAVAPQAPAGVSEAEMRENVRKALIQLGVTQRAAKQLAQAAQGTNDTEMLRDALARRKPPQASRQPVTTSPAVKPTPALQGAATTPAPQAATPALGAPEGAPTKPNIVSNEVVGNPHAEEGAPDYIPTVDAVRLAQKAVGAEAFQKLTEGREGGEPHQDATIRAYTAEQVAREIVDAAKRGADPVQEVSAKSAKIYERAKEVQARRDAATAVKPAPEPDTAAEDDAVEQKVNTLAKTKEDRLPVLLQLATERAGGDPRLLQTRTDKRGKVTTKGRLDFNLPEHRALINELGLSPEEAANIQQAQESSGVKFVDYFSAPKEKGAEGDISGKQRRAEYEADKLRKSRREEDKQTNKAIIFTNAAVKVGKLFQTGFSVDKYIANVHKLIQAAKEHNLPVDYSGINDEQWVADANGYAQNHKNNIKGDGSGPVKGETPTPGYEPYLIPRNRFDLLNAAFHNEASTGQSKYEAKVRDYEAAKARGEKTRKPALRQETAENAQEAQDLARENDWQVDDATGDTNPFRAMLNREGKLTHPGKGGALRQGTAEVLEPVWETLSPDMIQAIRDEPQGDRDIVRDVGYTGEPKGVFAKGLPDFRRVGGGFMPEVKKSPSEELRDIAERAYPGGGIAPNDIASILERNIEYGIPSALPPREMAAAAKRARELNPKMSPLAEQPKTKPGDTVTRIVHKDGKGLIDRSAWDLSKLTEDEQLELPSLLDYGMEQPRDVATGNKFYFTKDGLKRHAELIRLLAKASKSGGIKKETITLKESPAWESADGQVAIKPPSFMPEAKGALSDQIAPYDPTETARTLGIKYDGPIAGTDAHQFTAPGIGTQGGATFTVRGEPTPEKVAAKLAQKQQAFGGRFMPKNQGAIARGTALNEPEKPAFYSQLARVAADKIKGRATPEQITATLRNNGVKQEELDWVLGDYLKGKAGQKITPEELRDAIAQNRVELKEVKKSLKGGLDNQAIDDIGFLYEDSGQHELGDQFHEALTEGNNRKAAEMLDEFAKDPTDYFGRDEAQRLRGYAERLREAGDEPNNPDKAPKFGQYQLPGGKNYRELLFTLPAQELQAGWKIISKGGKYYLQKPNGELHKDPSGNDAYWSNAAAAQMALNYNAKNPDVFRSTHFDEPNILFHTRVNDRQTVDGKSMLFAEELQSDWHQKGRKEGYSNEPTTVYDAYINGMPAGTGYKTQEQAQSLIDSMKARAKESGINTESAIYEIKPRQSTRAGENFGGVVPNAPFKGEGWKRLGLKKLLAKAVEEGKDSIGWTTGATQSERYDLSKQVDSITYRPTGDGNYEVRAVKGPQIVMDKTIPEKELENYLGKDLAGKIIGGGGDAGEGNILWEKTTEPNSVRELGDDVLGGKMASLVPLNHLDGGMLTALQNNKVQKAVIARLPVDVVNILGSVHLTPEDLFRNKDVVADHLPSAEVRHTVARGVIGAIRETGTDIRAKLGGLKPGGGDFEILPALRASDLNSREVAGLLDPKRLFHGGADVGEQSAASTGAVTKPALGDNGGPAPSENNSQISPAKLAQLLNAHAAVKTGNKGIVKPKFEAPEMTLKGNDLKVESSGMKGFYDRELVNIANDIGKKYGARVQKAEIDSGIKPRSFVTGEQARSILNAGGRVSYIETRDPITDPAQISNGLRYVVDAPANTTVWQLPITPELRAAVKAGQSLFMPDNGKSSSFETKTKEGALAAATQKARFMPAPEGELKKEHIHAAAKDIASAAQRVYDEWQQDHEGFDEEFGTGGICDRIADEISDIMTEQGWHVSPGGQEGDDHAYIVVTDGKKAFEVDIPPHVYETGGGYNWKKRPGVQFNESHIAITPVPLEAVDPDVLDEARGNFMPKTPTSFQTKPASRGALAMPQNDDQNKRLPIKRPALQIAE